MAETTPLPSSDPVSAESDYRPLSGLAVGGLALAVIYSLLFLGFGAVSLVTGAAFILPEWFIFLAVGGAVLSFFARRQIRNSEGTRAGLALATSGLWLSVVFGLGYLAYSMTIDFAVRRQAEDFLVNPDKGFFAVLKDPGRLTAAFLLTQPPDKRANLNPDDVEAIERTLNQPGPMGVGQLDIFRFSGIVCLLQVDGPDTEAAVKSITRSTYEKQSYAVDLVVQVRTKEAEFDVPLKVRSGDSPTGGRQWYVDWSRSPSPTNVLFTPFGKQLLALRVASHQFLTRWLDDLRDGKYREVKQRACQFEDFGPEGSAIDLRKIETSKHGGTLRKWLKLLFDPDDRNRSRISIDPVPMCCKVRDPGNIGAEDTPFQATWEVTDKNRLRIRHEFRFAISHREEPSSLRFIAYLTVERTDPGTTDFDPSKRPSWCVVGLVVDRIQKLRPDGRPEGFQD